MCKVSICCMTYNQESYIKDAINGFLCQKTNFDYEIIIHDDCSTDNTANIVKEYQEKYPELIKAILQKENQYSKGKNILNFCLAEASGEYIAICEGDDFWTDEYKLQKQIDILDANTQYSCCMHNVEWLNCQTNISNKVEIYGADRVVDTKQFLTGDRFPYNTCSLVIRKDLIQKMPDWVYACPVGDIPMQLYATMKGEMYFMKDYMATYRCMAINSWSIVQKQDAKLYYGIKSTLETAKTFSNENEAFDYRIGYENLIIAGITSDKKLFKESVTKATFNQLPLKMRIKFWLKTYMPKIVNVLRRVWKQG